MRAVYILLAEKHPHSQPKEFTLNSVPLWA
jgi:hypothetical protein